MPDDLILDFPVLRQESGDFVEDVSYEVKAIRDAQKITVTHIIKGQSFIRQLVKNTNAKFGVLLLYRDSSERQHHSCDVNSISTRDNEIVVEQIISLGFPYAPEITPSIIILEDQNITVDSSSGLTDFWGIGERFHIPQYSRIAIAPKLKFTSGDVSKLMEVVFDEKLSYGEMRVVVDEGAGEGERPVSLVCGKDVYDELYKIKKTEPNTPIEAMRSAIVTQALCAVYAHMKNLQNPNEDYETSGVLAAHLEELEDKTGENWEYEDFNPSLAATKMRPYVIKAFNEESNDD